MTRKPIDAEAVLGRLGSGSIFSHVDALASTGSTNADLAAAAHAGAAPGLVLVAGEQTAGRGRRARHWASPAGGSISMSMLLLPAQPVARWGWLSLLAGLSVADALERLAPEPGSVELKWPNDVLIRGRKVCGILSEHVPAPRGSFAVVGLGINVGLEREHLPVPTATSLRLEGWPQDHEAVVSEVLQAFQGHYRTWEATGTLRPAYGTRCASIGTPLRITVTEDHVVEGVGHGVDDEGRLLVATGRGVQAFAVGDVVHARMDHR